MLAERIEALCHQLLPRGQLCGNEWRVGSVAGEGGNSLAVQLVGRWRGRWRDWATGERGGALDLVQAVLRLADKRDAIQWAVDWLAQRGADARGDADDASLSNTIDSTDVERRRIEAALRVWHDTKEAAGSPVERYLRSRGITIEVPPSLRYAPHLWHGPTGLWYPAMVAAVVGVDGDVTGVHRTYLATDGVGKVPVSPSKMMLGQCAGGAVRLGSPGPVLAVAEGIETAISVAQECPHLDVWAALSTSGMRSLFLPPTVDEVVLCPDGDEAGEQAARCAARRFLSNELKVRIAHPPVSADFNDVIVAHRTVEDAK